MQTLIEKGTRNQEFHERSTLDEINLVEILDRVLDKGIVVDPSTRVYLLGKELRRSRGRMVVESLQVY
ncbi:MAG TPA: gas vesicle protein GvpJ [Candidatus Angelobacter sp.]|nr:gas vesicle protein GvpJ [Candidatus Angelobacter sp.]